MAIEKLKIKYKTQT